MSKQKSLFTSIGIILAALGLSYAPLPGLSQTIVIVSGSELQEPLAELERSFEQKNPSIKVEVKIQGSQDVVNRYLNDENDFNPAVLIPANGDLLVELQQRWAVQNSGQQPFDRPPQPVARTILVGVAWPDRGKALFPNGQFDWSRVEMAMRVKNWSAIAGQPSWGSFDFLMTDPVRSNSGQLTLGLWARDKAGGNQISSAILNKPQVLSLFELSRRSVYQPPRSTDILLQEFITRGPNDADLATVYESAALYRWEQANLTKGMPYQIYYFSPTVETVSTAGIVTRNLNRGQIRAARKFVDFLIQSEQQQVFVRYGFRPASSDLDLKAVPGSPWAKNIPGANPQMPELFPLPDRETLNEVIRLWQRSN